jgi:hypothetical protein
MDVINIDEDYPSILSRICKTEDLYDFLEEPMDSGKSAYVYKAKSKDQFNVVVRMTYHPFLIEITPIEWLIKDRHFSFLNMFPQFFPHTYHWGVVSNQEIINTYQHENINYTIRYEILEYVPTELIPKTSDTLFSLYRFLYEFWSTGFTHGDLTLRNIRYYHNQWRFIDLDSVHYKPLDEIVPFITPTDFYCRGNGHRDHNNFTIIINSVPEWKSIISCKKDLGTLIRNSNKRKRRLNKKSIQFKRKKLNKRN